MTGYTKLFASIVSSTVWDESPEVCKLWITMLALADQDGIVEASVPGLANHARVSVEQTEAALAKFMAPDRYSRSPEFEGRRIEPVDGGWRLLNHLKYRMKMSKDDRQERDRLRKRRLREQLKQQCPTESGTEPDNSEMSEKSNNHTQKAEAHQNPKENTHSADVAKRVCVKLGLSGSRNLDRISAVIDGEALRTQQSLGDIETRITTTWAEYQKIPASGFKYDSVVAFLESGAWLRPESWSTANNTSDSRPRKPTSSVSERTQLQAGELSAKQIHWRCPTCNRTIPYGSDCCTNSECADAGRPFVWEGMELEAGAVH